MAQNRTPADRIRNTRHPSILSRVRQAIFVLKDYVVES